MSPGKSTGCSGAADLPSIPADRRHFTLAHELGHALLHREAFPGKEAEIQADRFAAELLLPESSAKLEMSSKYAFGELKEPEGTDLSFFFARYLVDYKEIIYIEFGAVRGVSGPNRSIDGGLETASPL